MSIIEKEGKPFDAMSKTVELLKPEEKPKSNVHPLFGRILRQWERIQPVEGPDPRD